MTIGDKVRDTYTGRTGTILAIDQALGRCTVALGVYKMTGCLSWFAPVSEIDEEMVPR